MQRVETNGLQCWADSVRYSNAAYWSREVAVLSMFGPRNAVRAAWARLTDTTPVVAEHETTSGTPWTS